MSKKVRNITVLGQDQGDQFTLEIMQENFETYYCNLMVEFGSSKEAFKLIEFLKGAEKEFRPIMIDDKFYFYNTPIFGVHAHSPTIFSLLFKTLKPNLQGKALAYKKSLKIISYPMTGEAGQKLFDQALKDEADKFFAE